MTCETDETGVIVNKTEVTQRFTNSGLLLLIVLSFNCFKHFFGRKLIKDPQNDIYNNGYLYL